MQTSSCRLAARVRELPGAALELFHGAGQLAPFLDRPHGLEGRLVVAGAEQIGRGINMLAGGLGDVSGVGAGSHEAAEQDDLAVRPERTADRLPEELSGVGQLGIFLPPRLISAVVVSEIRAVP